MKKPTNHLASHTEKLANLKLPFAEQFEQLNQLTLTVKRAWQPLLPETMLSTLLVVSYDHQTITLTTNNHTLANHLTYSHQPLLAQLHQTVPTLQQVTRLKFNVVQLERITTTNSAFLQSNENVKNVTSCKLSEFTKQNIAQLAEIVTDDDNLQKALQKLIN